MATLENENLVFRFPQIEKDAIFSINFQRTLRIPDTDKTYSLPPGLGSFPVRHVEDFTGRIPASMTDRGGVILPMWQAEAMWLLFKNHGPDWELDFPVAIKIAAGKVNAVTGDPWRPGLHREPQDYLVSPEQPWLDGFAIEKGVIRQFVAMPLGDGYTPEEQLTGDAKWGGIQISVTPLKRAVWEKKFAAWREEQRHIHSRPFVECCDLLIDECSSAMGLAAGGRMKQEIYEDSFSLDDWDQDATDRVFVSLVHAKDWRFITGEAAPNEPPSAEEYSAAGLPWFDYYGKDQTVLHGSKKLANIKSVANIFKEQTGAQLAKSSDTAIGKTVKLGPGLDGSRTIMTSNDRE